jgi:prepilin-type processing-associated H-X9-DG protein
MAADFTARGVNTGYAKKWVVLWPHRLLKYTKKQAGVFNCPSATADTRWDGKRWLVDSILAYPASQKDYFQAVFSYGYNDWGIKDNLKVGGWGLGLGAHSYPNYTDPNGDGYKNRWTAEPPADFVKRPSDMVAIVDSNSDGVFDTVYDPTPRDSYHKNGDEGPGKRHNKGANALFCDGHAESFRQRNLCAYLDQYESATPSLKNPMARMFNSDNKPHFDHFPPP